MKHLIIVESPAKARTIKNFLGKDYEVIATKGHIRDLPKSKFGITVEDNVFVPQYTVARENSATVKEIKKLAKEATKADKIVYIATDEDREGEAIGFHISEAIGLKPYELPRIAFHEITKSAIMHAIENPRKMYKDLVDAQQTRRLLDRIVGYKLSPLLGSKIQRGLSAGRVQSSSLKIVIDKERDIKAFIPVEYWSVNGDFKELEESSLLEYKGKKTNKMFVGNGELAKEIKTTLDSEIFKIGDIEKKNRITKTSPPFMTSTLQQSASSSLGFSPKKTMMVAQKLYEGVKTPSGMQGVITYMRTDSLNLAKESVESVRAKILKEFGDKYLPEKTKVYASKAKGAQEAHEAIRPTNLEFTPEIAAGFLNSDEIRLYKLIYNRFVACQMNDARFELNNLIIQSESAKFKASGRKLVFDGFYKIYGDNDKDKLLPDIKIGTELNLNDIVIKQNFTEPPSRYSEASLIKKLEEMGIGRPSTYAPTISILAARRYVEIEAKRITPTEIAFKVIEMLEEHFSNIVDSSFTSKLEDTLDEIAEGNMDWQQVLTEFYDPFMQTIKDGKENIKSQKVIVEVGRNCPECEAPLVERIGRFGKFVSCSAFPKCRFIEKDPNRKVAVKIGIDCPKCEKELVERNGKKGKFYGCSGYPKCRFTSADELLVKSCPKCEAKVMAVKEEEDGSKKEYCLECDVPKKVTRKKAPAKKKTTTTKKKTTTKKVVKKAPAKKTTAKKKAVKKSVKKEEIEE